MFLYEKLGFQWDEVHIEADRLEHASSNKLIERLSEFLGNPQYDPHGGIIPNADGTFDEEAVPLIALDELEPDLYFLVKEVLDDEELLNYLYAKGFELNKVYKLIAKDAYDGTVTILDSRRDLILYNKWESNEQYKKSKKLLTNKLIVVYSILGLYNITLLFFVM